MIKKFLTFMAFASAFTMAVTIHAQKTYLPILEIGKKWTGIHYSVHEGGYIHESPWTSKVEDKMEEDGHQVFTLLYQDSDYDDESMNLVKRYEENGVLWSYHNEHEGHKPIVDFNLEVGDNVIWDCEVVWKDYVDIEGIMRCVIAIQSPGSRSVYYWVEGIGAVDNLSLIPMIMSDEWSRLKECWMGDICIFKHDRMNEYMSGIDLSEVKSLTGKDASDAPCYDILGRRITDPVPGQLYIRNGKKHIAK